MAACNRTVPLPPPRVTWRRIRKSVHLGCFLAFVTFPFVDLMRFDIPRQRFYFAGFELWINEFGIIFFALMFLLFLIVASSVFYGRVYCGYLCPQMIFSEASVAVESRLRRWVNKYASHWSARRRNFAARALFLAIVAIASVFLAFVFISYFVEPRDLFRRLSSLDVQTAGGVAGAAVTLITFLDFTLVRQRFCTTVCPYGYLQGMLGDGNTLLVHYRDEGRQCIECKKCVRVCQMGVDIRASPYQIECIHCGDCIDACADVLGRLGKQGLIHYAWGERGEPLGQEHGAWYQRLDARDPKRVVVLLVALFYACGLFVALSMRSSVLVRLAPVRTKLYRVGQDGRVYNRFRFMIANRGKRAAAVILALDQLPGATLHLRPNPVPVKAGDSMQGEFEISAPLTRTAAEVSHFRITASFTPERASETFPMTFLMPPQRSPQ